MSCHYTLYFQYDVNKFYLAPQSSIYVVEDPDFEKVEYVEGCACADIKSREWSFKVHFKGNCDYNAARIMYNRFTAFMTAGCAHGDMTFNRIVCDEAITTWNVTLPKFRWIDTINQFTQARIITMDLSLRLDVWPPDGVGEVVIG